MLIFSHKIHVHYSSKSNEQVRQMVDTIIGTSVTYMYTQVMYSLNIIKKFGYHLANSHAGRVSDFKGCFNHDIFFNQLI